jgi:Lipid-droplet associated hydrolase
MRCLNITLQEGEEKSKSMDKSLGLQDTIYLRNTHSPARIDPRRYLIFVIPGNPGLVEYYRTFMTSLFSTLSATGAVTKSAAFDVYGRSLAGFEIAGRGPGGVVGLREQILFVEGQLCEAVRQIQRRGGKRPRVVLVGHSVGSYILLEIIRRHRERLESGSAVEGGAEPDVVGGVCLFPTVVDIGLSKRGVRMTVSNSKEARDVADAQE